MMALARTRRAKAEAGHGRQRVGREALAAGLASAGRVGGSGC